MAPHLKQNSDGIWETGKKNGGKTFAVETCGEPSHPRNEAVEQVLERTQALLLDWDSLFPAEH